MRARPRFREAFDQGRDFVAVRELQTGFGILVPGQVVPKTQFSVRRLRQLFDGRRIGYAGETGFDRARPVNPKRIRLVDWGDMTSQAAALPQPQPKLTPIPRPRPQYAVEIPEGWQRWTWPRILGLAASLTSKPVRTKRDVFKTIHEEIARRARAEAPKAA